MRISLLSVAVIATFAVAVSFLGVRRSPECVAAPKVTAEGPKMLGRLPVAFVPNLGQWEHGAQYVARVGAMTVFLEQHGWSVTLVERPSSKERERRDSVDERPARGVAVRMTFAGARQPEIIAEERLPGVHNYFLGNDPSKWRSDVPLYGAVRYREVYSGVDVRAREHDGHFEYDLLLQPGADLEPVEIVVGGIDRMHLDEQGALVMETRLGPVRMPVPLSWEEGASGEKELVACRYVLRSGDRFGFEVTGRRPGWSLIVDPGLVWSTFLGGTSDESATAIALDAQGAATVAGYTLSGGFPTTPGAFDTSFGGGLDAFVTRLSPTGSALVYSTFLGGATSSDHAADVALDAQGAATVTGMTHSSDFPTTPGAFDTSFGGFTEAFVTRLSPTGSTLLYSTFLGGADRDDAMALAVDAQGAATVTGYTYSSDFPTTPGAFETSYSSGDHGEAFVTRLSPTASTLVYSTFLGGANLDSASALAVDAAGVATVAGQTDSPDFPTTPGAFDTSFGGGTDAFVTRLSPNGSTLVYSTFLGGTLSEAAFALALDALGAATVAGTTSSTDFPTTPGAFDTSFGGAIDAFVSQLSPTGSTLVYSTYVGGVADDDASALALDAQGAATVTGWTRSPDFPTTPGAFGTSFNGGNSDAFVTRLSPPGSTLIYSTYVGGVADDDAYALALDAQGAATVTGWTYSADFPTTPAAFDPSFGGDSDAFVTRLDMLPTGVGAWGDSSPGCNGPLPISVTSMPQVGNAAFALTCGNAAPNSVGLIAFGGGLVNPIPVLGVNVWIDPSVLFATATVFSNPIGACELPLPIPADPAIAGFRFFAQFLWLGPGAPLPCPPMGFSATNALDISIQP